MTTNAMPVEETTVVQATPISTTQQFYWSVRREFWEHRSIYVAPVAVGLLIFGASTISAFQLPGRVSALDPAQQHNIIEQPYMLASLLLMLTEVLVAFYYCLEAFQGERRDRSILFWKSMPVSDLVTVGAKASIPLLALPLVAFAATVVTQVLMLLVGMIRLAAAPGVAPVWSHVPLLQIWPMLLYHLVACHGLWYAPFFGWLLLVSAWARRAPLLWATVPLLALAMLERIAFNTSYFASLLIYRFAGAPEISTTNPMSMDSLVPTTITQFLTSPGFWLGLGFFTLCIAGAVRLRRHRDWA